MVIDMDEPNVLFAREELKAALTLLKDIQAIPARVEARSITLYDDNEKDVIEDALEAYAEALMAKLGYTQEQIQLKIHGRWYVNMMKEFGGKKVKR
jgi:hypothetical protein